MTIDALPAAPSRSDTPANFILKADAFVAALATLVAQINATAAGFSVTLWVTGTTYAQYAMVYSPSNLQTYRKSTASSVSSTDPASDPANWTLVQYAGLPRGHIAGLTLSNNATVTKLDVAAGSCRDSTNVIDINLTSAITAGLIQTSGAWAAGSTQNKLDTGARANSTWYHVWAILKDIDGSGDFLFSLSASAPTMPSGYTYKRRIGSVKTDGSGNIYSFTQDGDYFQWTAPIVSDVTSGGAPGISAISETLAGAPTGVNVEAEVQWVVNNAAAAGTVYGVLSDLATTDTAPGATYSDIPAVASTTATVVNGVVRRRVRTNTSAQIRARISYSDGNVSFRINTLGWVDTRGRNS